MMFDQTFIFSVTSFALLPLLAACCLFPHVEAIKLHSANIHALTMKKFEPPSTTSMSAGGTTATRVVGLRRGSGLGATSTTTATAKSITTTTTMMDEDDEMSPSDFYVLHLREHGLALAEQAAAAALEENYDGEEERDPRQRRHRGRQRRRELLEIVERQRERPHLDHDQQQQEQQETPPPEEEEVDEAESEQLEEEEESGQVDQQPIGGVDGSASPTGDGDGDGTDDDIASVIAGPPFSPPSSNNDSAVDGIDVSIDITDACNVTDREWLGDGYCHGSYSEGYNTAECGWDGGDCCYQTCRDGVARCGQHGIYDCRDPRFSNIVYDEEGERDPQRRRERQALKALYDATNGKGWYDQGQWLNDTLDHCYWHPWNIRCTGGEGYVWGIFPMDPPQNLDGTLPTEIGDLVHLEDLDLEGNKGLSGTIPALIGNLTKLAGLGANGTSLSGPVPANVMTFIFGTPYWYYSPDNTDDYAELSPDNCADVVGWTDADGDGCDSYTNNTSSCPTDGTQHGDMGHAADTACCTCGLYATYDREREVLEELYGATNVGGWHDNSFWTNGSTSHCYFWTGVQCSPDGMVTNIMLSSNNLHGSLPTSIGELRSLRVLDVSDNVITGGIPTELYTLPNLEGLHLRNLSIGGTLPVTQLASLSLLRRLDLSHNGLTGPIPVGITNMSLVEDLRLSHNQLTGTISPEFRRMIRLKRLDLDYNKLVGSIPVDIGLLSLLRELRVSNQRYQDIYYDYHYLSGPIPVELGDCQYLEVLDLSDNRLTGSLPTELARLARLKSLLLHDNNFEGRIPSEYGLLQSLESLTLGVYESWWDEQKLKPAPLSLCFDGAFDLHSDPSWCPPERNALKRLYDATGGDGWSNSANWTDPYGDHCSWYGVGCEVRVSCRDVQTWTDSEGDDCDTYGRNPDWCSEYGDLYEHGNHTANTACCFCQQEKYGCSMNGAVCVKDYVTSLSLNSNGLSGALPAELGQLSLLERLHLADNALVGGLPSDIAKLTKLHLLNLTGNALSGGFPEEITNLPSLSEVHLSRNELSGELSIPAGTNSSNLTILHFANNKFRGEISTAFDQLRSFPSLQKIDMSNNLFHGSMPSTPMDDITKLTVGGNERLTSPIPSSLCHNRTLDLDLQDSPVHCPVLSFLHLFYDSMNGTSWNRENVAGVCDESSWSGIVCDVTNTSIVTINLTNYGLSGTLPDSFGEHMSALSFLRVLDLSHNGLHGPIPVDLARLSLLEEVRLSNNIFSGTLPAQISNLPRLKILDMDNNRLTGVLPIEYGRLSSLRELRLSGNCLKEIDSNTGNNTICGLSGEIPADWGNLGNLEHLDLSGNFLTGSIPAALGNLGGLAELLLHNNSLVGLIPSALGRLTQIEVLALKDNSGLEELAPLSVCALPHNFDLKSESRYCPTERNVLKIIFEATNGGSWASNTNWLDEYSHPCNSTKKWLGITCTNEFKISNISLIGNGLYGTLPSNIAHLIELQELKLGDNRLYGTLPTDLVHLSTLHVLQLSGNDFSGEIPGSMAQLSWLSTLHLHANKFTKGDLSPINVSNVTADCGDPYYHGQLDCKDCAIVCCNSAGMCRKNRPEKLSLGEKTGIYMGCIIASLFILGAAVLLASKGLNLPEPEMGVVEYCGTGSIYRFILSLGCSTWVFSALTVAAQLAIFTVFLQAADVMGDNSDWVYFLRCPPNQLWCESDYAVSYQGWLMFGIIMVAFLGKDLVSGVMLVYASGLSGSFRCFVSGIVISSLTSYTVWTSTQYNIAIATTDTALISNAVIILFVNELDERIFQLFQRLFPNWVAGVMVSSNSYSEELMTKSDGGVSVVGQQQMSGDELGSVVEDEGSEEDDPLVGSDNDLQAKIEKQNDEINDLREQIEKQKQQITTMEAKLDKVISKIPHLEGQLG